MFALDIISDPVCPWCYIGKAQLDRAEREAGTSPFARVWRPFQLNPDMPREGMDRATYLAAKFGAGRAEMFYRRIAEAAEAAGLSVDFARIRRTPNTLDAHRVIRWARADGAQDRVVDSLFRRYFRDGEDISDHAVLADAAAEAGMDAALVADLLPGEADRAGVAAEDAEARGLGIGGVPTFIIGGRHVLSGAQDSAVWGRAIAELSRLAPRAAAHQET